MASHWKVGIFLFNEVEVLDFAGPFEVFSVTTLDNGDKPFAVRTVSEKGGTIRASGGLKVITDDSFASMPQVDILVIPGGFRAREIEIHNDTTIRWIAGQMRHVQYMTSVCTGALLLAEAGLLNGKKATTHWARIDRFQNREKRRQVCGRRPDYHLRRNLRRNQYSFSSCRKIAWF